MKRIKKYEIGDKINDCIYAGNDIFLKNGSNNVRFSDFICKCGKRFNSRLSSVCTGRTLSCGCAKIKHGSSYTSEYNIYHGMIQRCYNHNAKGYRFYGGIGITVCDRWIKSFDSFISDMGKRPSENHTIDRFPDKKGGYEPGNCRWATRIQQSNNLKNNVLLIYRGEVKSVSMWSRELGINSETIRSRIRYGWDLNKVLKS